MNIALSLQFLSCAFMTGIIWLVQLLIYPGFRLISDATFTEFHEFHTRRITWVVAPGMLLELATGLWLFSIEKDSIFFWNLMSIAVVWGFTAFVSVPLHGSLERASAAADAKNRLIRTNWPRTAVWTLRLVGLLWLIHMKETGAIP